MLAEDAAAPAFANGKGLLHLLDAIPVTRRAQKFPQAASVKISLSKVRSETARRRRWFSFSVPSAA